MIILSIMRIDFMDIELSIVVEEMLVIVMQFGSFECLLCGCLLVQMGQFKGCCFMLDDVVDLVEFGMLIDGEELLCVYLCVFDLCFYWLVVVNGSVGVGEVYIEGMWYCDDLVVLICIMVCNCDLFDGMESGFVCFGGLVMKVWYVFN